LSAVRRLVKAAPAGHWPPAEAAGSITLGFDDRNRRRFRLTTDQGVGVLLDLAKAQPLAEGDGLGFEDGGWLLVHAADEDVLEIAAADSHHLARLAWHLGNRHLPTEILPECLRIRYDHVTEDMLSKLGARLARRSAPFQPEGGAYGGHHDHGDHHHD
jgi:urease accessory protein